MCAAVDWESRIAVLPRGTVTFLLTDIEASSRRWEENSQAMKVAIGRHDALLGEGILEHAGTVLKERGEGDSFFAVFARASDAVAAACSIQRALHAEPWPDQLPIRVRMAIHTGEAHEEAARDYRGSVVNRCARLRALARGGQILISASVRELTRDRLPPGVTLKDMGEHRLRDLDRPERVFQVVDPALPVAAPRRRPLATLTRLPLPAVAALCGVLAVSAALAVYLIAQPRAVVVPGADTVAILDPGAARFTAAVPVGQQPTDLVVGGGSVWVTNYRDGTLSQVEMKTGRVLRTLSLSGLPTGVAFAAGSVWITTGLGLNGGADLGSVLRFEPATGIFDRPVVAGDGIGAIAVGRDGFLWIVNKNQDAVVRVNPSDGTVSDPIAVGAGPEAVAIAPDGSVWVADTLDSTVQRIDPGTDTIAGTISLAGGTNPTAIAIGFGAVWVASASRNVVIKIDLATGNIAATITVGNEPTSLAIGPAGIWVTEKLDMRVAEIDPNRNAVAQSLPVGGNPAGIAADGRQLWVAVGGP